MRFAAHFIFFFCFYLFINLFLFWSSKTFEYKARNCGKKVSCKNYFSKSFFFFNKKMGWKAGKIEEEETKKKKLFNCFGLFIEINCKGLWTFQYLLLYSWLSANF